MKKLIIASLMFTMLSSIALSQKKTYIGFDFGYKGDIFQYSDNGHSLIAEPVGGIAYGLNAGQELTDNLLFESGFYIVNYWSSIRVREFSISSSVNSLESYQIPLRVNQSYIYIKTD